MPVTRILSNYEDAAFTKAAVVSSVRGEKAFSASASKSLHTKPGNQYDDRLHQVCTKEAINALRLL